MIEVGFLPLSLSVLSLDTGSLTGLQLTGSAGLADQEVPGIFLALPSSVITGTLWGQAFYQALERKLSSFCCTTSTSSHGLRDKLLQFQAPGMDSAITARAGYIHTESLDRSEAPRLGQVRQGYPPPYQGIAKQINRRVVSAIRISDK